MLYIASWAINLGIGFSRLTAHDVISYTYSMNNNNNHFFFLITYCVLICTWKYLYIYFCIFPSHAHYMHLSKAPSKSRSPIISSIFTSNLHCAWYWNQTQPSTSQILLSIFFWILHPSSIYTYTYSINYLSMLERIKRVN